MQLLVFVINILTGSAEHIINEFLGLASLYVNTTIASALKVPSLGTLALMISFSAFRKVSSSSPLFNTRYAIPPHRGSVLAQYAAMIFFILALYWLSGCTGPPCLVPKVTYPLVLT